MTDNPCPFCQKGTCHIDKQGIFWGCSNPECPGLKEAGLIIFDMEVEK